ncbi:Maf-like protein [Kipferlia bialata]|uniref:Maf-like protein n=1 Tax=Kipferlia bialata TaxID=797122 RepID=A0A9K3D6A3_9EUKA|nr:Maf-like protein [Kipferlia bialata]|eukprot:g10715.t1
MRPSLSDYNTSTPPHPHASCVDAPSADITVACDTVVVSPDSLHILEKPRSRAECVQTLAMLNGATHSVVSGVVLTGPNGFRAEFTETTRVTFNTMPLSLIEAYADTDEPYDKAGGYGIQATAASWVSGIEGDYFNVVGLPLCALCTRLRHMLTGTDTHAQL